MIREVAIRASLGQSHSMNQAGNHRSVKSTVICLWNRRLPIIPLPSPWPFPCETIWSSLLRVCLKTLPGLHSKSENSNIQPVSFSFLPGLLQMQCVRACVKKKRFPLVVVFGSGAPFASFFQSDEPRFRWQECQIFPYQMSPKSFRKLRLSRTRKG
ncbi:hypothetical protein BDP81DRAFT_30465 [Colletotrichum phormii]|uniref:Uncharacterized protein n=1 Tax=Colletotrichum phormii TaxID=359342 RepID=A0AAI9ZTX1_9PEZI|nr:uncharacterized protein BDP81DRAFT_30465 [Colletotrichum phormii]KAK1636903.1 hypothetical protein BDP81DRAFT_30465 [Colletotrichum phormii]